MNGSSASFNVTDEGSYTMHYKAQDNAGNWESTKQTWFGIDTVAPSLAVQAADDTAHQTTVPLDLSAADTGSGVYQVRVSDNAVFWSDWQSYSDQILWMFPALDRHTLNVYVQVRDYAGNESPIVNDTVTMDLYPIAPHSADYRICNETFNAGGSLALTSTGYVLASSIGLPLVERGGLLGLRGCAPIARPAYDPLEQPHYVVGAEGNLHTGNGYRLVGTMGEPLASGTSAFSGGGYVLSSGFWGYSQARTRLVYLPLVLRGR